MIALSKDFEDSEELLELQKIKTDYDEFTVNFQEEPNKS